MKQLQDLFEKKERLVIGLMSGTSADGIDAALVRIKGNSEQMQVTQLDFISSPYPTGFKEFLIDNSQVGTSDVADITALNFLIAQFHSEAVHRLLSQAGVSISDIDLIGSHGQTIHHIPHPVRLFDRQVSGTLQIGDPSVLAKLTGIVTVGDFRVGDMALGGQGAPLVPYFDYVMFRSDAKTRALLNIGGISNITFIPRGASVDDVVAFDTGPGNMLVDRLMVEFYRKEFDEDGKTAHLGEVKEDIINFLMNDDFVRATPPKSTGRERYGEKFVEEIKKRFAPYDEQDIIASVAEFTCLAIHLNYKQFLLPLGPIDELLVSGGGAHNLFIMESLRKKFAPAVVEPADNRGLSSDAKEAVCFAVLANETISGIPTNLPRVTGASRRTVLGKICIP